MIDISMVSLVMLYLAGVAGLVGAVWWISTRRQRREWRKESRSRVPCRACGHVFIDRGLAGLAVCPHCGRPNERDG